MTVAKKPDHLADFCKLCDAFSDMTRLRIVKALAERGRLNVTELVTAVEGQSQPAVSHHLSLLRFGGIIQYTRDGKHNSYSLVNPEAMRATLTWFAALVSPVAESASA